MHPSRHWRSRDKPPSEPTQTSGPYHKPERTTVMRCSPLWRCRPAGTDGLLSGASGLLSAPRAWLQPNTQASAEPAASWPVPGTVTGILGPGGCQWRGLLGPAPPAPPRRAGGPHQPKAGPGKPPGPAWAWKSDSRASGPTSGWRWRWQLPVTVAVRRPRNPRCPGIGPSEPP
jgi:hypothetical protein